MASNARRVLAQPVFPDSDSTLTYGQVVTVREIARKAGLSESVVASIILDPDSPEQKRSAVDAEADELDRQAAQARQEIRVLFRVTALRRIVQHVDKTGLPAKFSSDERIMAAGELARLVSLYDIRISADDKAKHQPRTDFDA